MLITMMNIWPLSRRRIYLTIIWWIYDKYWRSWEWKALSRTPILSQRRGNILSKEGRDKRRQEEERQHFMHRRDKSRRGKDSKHKFSGEHTRHHFGQFSKFAFFLSTNQISKEWDSTWWDPANIDFGFVRVDFYFVITLILQIFLFQIHYTRPFIALDLFKELKSKKISQGYVRSFVFVCFWK